MTLRIGETIGDYEVVGVLGQGGMGEVFRVRNVISDRIEAMKVVLPNSAANSELAERFLREIKLHASLDHPNIAALHTALRVDDQIVMVMELVEGSNIAARLAQGPLDWRDAVRYVGQVLSALAFAHARGIIHRDIKPANIMVTETGVVKLTDFGIAHSAGDLRLTMTGMALGSLSYMSPEQVTSAPVDARSDLYSLGVTFYEMVTGVRPFQGTSEYALMTAHVSQVPTAAADVNPSIPRSVSAVIGTALEKDPARRFQSAIQFQNTLHAAIGSQAETSFAPATPTPGSASRFDSTTLDEIQGKLLPLLGPIAKQLVARIARRSSTVPELYRALAEQIPGERERAAFLQSLRGAASAAEPPSRSQAAQPATTGPQVWDAALLQLLKEKLAPYVGPIAGIVVDRTSRKVKTRRELFDALAAEITAQRDREAFLASIR